MRKKRNLALGAVVLVGLGVVLVAAGGKGAKDDAAGKVRVLEITLGGEITEQKAVFIPFGPGQRLLRDYTGTIRKAAKDDAIKAIILRLKVPTLGLARVQELAAALKDFRDAGKPVYCYTEMCTNTSYALATNADKIVAAPGGGLLVVGLSMEVAYLKGLLDWAGIQFDVVHAGKHKSAGEPFVKEKMSAENRRVLDEFLDDYYAQFVGLIASGRKLDAAKVKALIDNGPYSAEEAKKAKLIDDVAYYEEFVEGIGEDLGGKVALVKKYHHLGAKGPDLSQFNIFTLFSSLQPKPAIPKTTRPKVVIIYATGQIVWGPTSVSFTNVISYEPIGKAFASARKDPTVKAVVLRIDSPGGSALTSDLIWREVERTRKAGKPVIASMGHVAASGGYYIAMGADEIIAEPTTITGSIGVIGLKPSLGELYTKIKVNMETFQRGKNAGLLSTTKPLSADERVRLEQLIKATYDDFVGKAFAGRKGKGTGNNKLTDVAKMRELATGRVWTGKQAKELGLVDELGDLKLAYQRAIAKAGIEGQDVQPVVLPREKNIFEALLGGAAQSRAATEEELAQRLPEPLRRLVPYARLLRTLTRERVLAIMPYCVEIR